MVLLFLLIAAWPETALSWREPPQLPGPPPAQRPTPEDEARAKLEKDMAKKRNQARHAELTRDTDKLLQLSTELKQYVEQSNEHTLSLDVIKKAEEIEKLAHSVKEKMKGSY
jgi:predicted  nucleic acid-binding Zn-ribbon protein